MTKDTFSRLRRGVVVQWGDNDSVLGLVTKVIDPVGLFDMTPGARIEVLWEDTSSREVYGIDDAGRLELFD